MRIKLPENFGSITVNEIEHSFEVDADGCTNVEDAEVSFALLEHGGTVAPNVEEANAEVDAEVAVAEERVAQIQSRRQRGR